MEPKLLILAKDALIILHKDEDSLDLIEPSRTQKAQLPVGTWNSIPWEFRDCFLNIRGTERNIP